MPLDLLPACSRWGLASAGPATVIQSGANSLGVASAAPAAVTQGGAHPLHTVSVVDVALDPVVGRRDPVATRWVAALGAGGRGVVARAGLDGRIPVPPAREAASVAPVGSSRYSVCVTCHGPAVVGHPRCWSCREVVRQLRVEPPLVVPTFLFKLGSAAHRALVGYKAAPTEPSREVRMEVLVGWLGAFLRAHGSCLTSNRAPVYITPVPSTIGGRPSWQGRHPLVSVCEQAVAACSSASATRPTDAVVLLDVLRPGVRPPRRLDARASGFFCDPAIEMSGRTIIVVDDVFTSGSRLLSAAAALTATGAHVAAVVPLGRVVRPQHNPATAAFWEDYSSRAFDPASCAVCSPVRRRVVARTTTVVVERLAA